MKTRLIIAVLVLMAGLLVLASQCTNDNVRPVALFSVDQVSGQSPLTVNFDASASYDPDESIVAYYWDFGDELSGTGARTSHTFSSISSQAYTVTLTVIDNNGKEATSSQIITVVGSGSVGRPPSITFIPYIERLFPITVFLDGFYYSCAECDNSHGPHVWDFGDGQRESCIYCSSATHEYAGLGPYTVQVTLTDDYGRTDTDTKIVDGHRLPAGTVVVDQTTSGTISINVGQTVAVYLWEYPGTAYVWEWTGSLVENVLEPAGERYIPGPFDPLGTDRIWYFEFRFKGVTPGVTPLEFINWEPWLEKPDRTDFGITVVVQ